MPKLGSMEVSAAFHEMADKGIDHAEDTFKNVKAATEEATQFFQHTYTAAARGSLPWISRQSTTTNVNNIYGGSPQKVDRPDCLWPRHSPQNSK